MPKKAWALSFVTSGSEISHVLLEQVGAARQPREPPPCFRAQPRRAQSHLPSPPLL